MGAKACKRHGCWTKSDDSGTGNVIQSINDDPYTQLVRSLPGLHERHSCTGQIMSWRMNLFYIQNRKLSLKAKYLAVRFKPGHTDKVQESLARAEMTFCTGWTPELDAAIFQATGKNGNASTES